MAYSQVAIIMLKKFSKARGEAVFMEEVTQEQRLESAKRRRQGRGQHPQGNPPTGWGHIRDGGGGTQAPRPLLGGEGGRSAWPLGPRRKQADSPWGTLAPVWLTLLHSFWRAPFADQ